MEAPDGFTIEELARNFRQPETGAVGEFVKGRLKEINQVVVHTAVRLSEIEPQHMVLEVGFGPGVGLRAAYEHIKDGSGKLFGVEISEPMLEAAHEEMKREIEEGRVSLSVSSVEKMPYSDNTFDRVFHCNCYYFWDDRPRAAAELYRVMKPGAMMVTTFNPKGVQAGKEKGYLRYGNSDPKPYMDALTAAGFIKVRSETVKDCPKDSVAIYSFVDKKK